MKTLTCILMCLSFSVSAGSIHKWVDENGNVHYGDAPPVSAKTKQLKVDGRPSNTGSPLPRLGEQGENAEAGAVPEDQAQIACRQAKEDLQVISNSSRIKLKQSDGTERYMTTEEIEQRRESAENDVERFCQ